MKSNKNRRLQAINESLKIVRATDRLLCNAQTAEMKIAQDAAADKNSETQKAALCVLLAERNATTLRRKLRHSLSEWFDQDVQRAQDWFDDDQDCFDPPLKGDLSTTNLLS